MNSVLPFRRLFAALAIAMLAMLAIGPVALAQQNAPGATAPAPAAPETTPVPVPAASPESVRILIDVLSDETARAALIEQLGRSAAPVTGPGDDVAGAPAMVPPAAEPAGGLVTPAGQPSLSRQLALATRAAIDRVAAETTIMWYQITHAPQTFAALDLGQFTFLVATLDAVLLLVVATHLLLVILRFASNGLRLRINKGAAHAGLLGKTVIVTGIVLTNLAIVAASWVIGYVLAYFFLDSSGEVGIRQSLYLNAFLATELVMIAVRAVVQPRLEAVRALPMPTAAARRLTGWIRIVVSIMTYGQLLLVPTFNLGVSFAAGRAISALIWLTLTGLVLALVFRWQKPVAGWLAGQAGPGVWGQTNRRLSRFWHWPVLAYFAFVLMRALTHSSFYLTRLLADSAKLAGALLIGVVAANLISRMITDGVRLPGAITRRLPLLENQLNAFVPALLIITRLVIIAALVLFGLDMFGFIDVGAWLASKFGVQMASAAASALFVVAGAFVLWLIINSWIDYRLNPGFGGVPTARERTLLALLRNAVTVTIIVFALMFALSEIGLDIAPLIASAGIIGIAIGFGAQELVKDVITGVFIQLEQAIDVGDVVTIGGITGTVDRLTIRSAALRDINGVYHIVPFSKVDKVSNYMRDFSYVVCDMGVAYREDIDDVRAAMFEAFAELQSNPDFAVHILEDLDWMGLQEFGDSAIVIRVRIKTVPGEQWGLSRAFNEILKRIFDAKGIEIPFPHQTIYFGEDRMGAAPAAHIAIDRGEAKPESESAPARKRRKPSRSGTRKRAGRTLEGDDGD